MENKSIFINPEYLSEESSSIDRLGYSDEINRVKSRIDIAVKNQKLITIAYLGPFGIGKSSILDIVERQTHNKYMWAKFETWQYSDRNELWRYFATSIISQVKKKKELHTIKEFDGGGWKNTTFAVVVIIIIGILSVVTSYFFWRKIDIFWSDYIKYILPLIVAVTTGIFVARYIKPKSPLRHNMQFEHSLTKALLKMKKPMVIVVEDIDRSGNDGAVFLETLHMFLKRISKDPKIKPLIIIAPQKNDCFDAQNQDKGKDRYATFESSLKIYDEKMYFNSKITLKSIDTFYEKLKIKKPYQKYMPAIIKITKLLIQQYRSQITMRLLKHALREVDWFIQSYKDHSPAIAFVFSMSRIVKSPRPYSQEEDLAVRNLSSTIQVQPNSQVNAVNVFGIALAIAAGSSCTENNIELVDDNCKLSIQNINTIAFDLAGGKDYIFKKDSYPYTINVSILKDYNEQLTI